MSVSFAPGPRLALDRGQPARRASGREANGRCDGAAGVEGVQERGADLRGAGLERVDLTAARLVRTRLDLAGAVALAEQHGAEVDPSS